MDSISMGFYGVICAALAALAPYFGAVWIRIVSGAAVGIGASLLLPAFRGTTGLY